MQPGGGRRVESALEMGWNTAPGIVDFVAHNFRVFPPGLFESFEKRISPRRSIPSTDSRDGRGKTPLGSFSMGDTPSIWRSMVYFDPVRHRILRSPLLPDMVGKKRPCLAGTRYLLPTRVGKRKGPSRCNSTPFGFLFPCLGKQERTRFLFALRSQRKTL